MWPFQFKAADKLQVTASHSLSAGALSFGVMTFTWIRLNDQHGFGSATETTYDVTRVATIGLGAIGAGLLIAGLLGRDRAGRRSHADRTRRHDHRRLVALTRRNSRGAIV